MTAHPSALWTEPPKPTLEIVRQRGGERMHQRKIGAAVALCGFEVPKWIIYSELPPTDPVCKKCWEIWGIALTEEGYKEADLKAHPWWPYARAAT